jgi:hypothetical protein
VIDGLLHSLNILVEEKVMNSLRASKVLVHQIRGYYTKMLSHKIDLAKHSVLLKILCLSLYED